MGKKSITETIQKILEEPFWLETLKSNEAYAVQADDTDGIDDINWLTVTFSPDGDAWISTSLDGCRFRTYFGGSRYPRVRTALMILAEAIRLDTEEHKREGG